MSRQENAAVETPVETTTGGMIEVTATKGANTITTNYDFGGSLQDMVAKFGEEVVFSNARQSMKISLQALLRRGIDKNVEPAKIHEQAAAWKPGVTSERVTDPVAQITSKWATLSEDKRKEIMEKLRAMA